MKKLYNYCVTDSPPPPLSVTGSNPSRKSSQTMRNNSYKSGRKSNEGWKKIRNEKRTNLEKKDPTNKISHEKVWRRKSEIENKRDDLAPENEEVSLTPNSDEYSIAYQPKELSSANKHMKGPIQSYF
jgi:hypothetical protein